LFDLASRFFAPTHNRVEPARTEAVKDGRVAPTSKGLGPWRVRARRHACCGRDDESPRGARVW